MASAEAENIPIDVADFLPENDIPAFAQKRDGAPDAAKNAVWEDLERLPIWVRLLGKRIIPFRVQQNIDQCDDCFYSFYVWVDC